MNSTYVCVVFWARLVSSEYVADFHANHLRLASCRCADYRMPRGSDWWRVRCAIRRDTRGHHRWTPLTAYTSRPTDRPTFDLRRGLHSAVRVEQSGFVIRRSGSRPAITQSCPCCMLAAYLTRIATSGTLSIYGIGLFYWSSLPAAGRWHTWLKLLSQELMLDMYEISCYVHCNDKMYSLVERRPMDLLYLRIWHRVIALGYSSVDIQYIYIYIYIWLIICH